MSSVCLPITALCTFQNEEQNLLFVGHGPFLQAYNLNTNKVLGSHRIFDVQTIHEIAIAPISPQTDAEAQLEVVVVGGSHISLSSVSLSAGWRWQNRCRLHAPDWILRAYYHNLGDGTGFFALLTANNALLRLDCGNAEIVDSVIQQLAQGPKSFLYSGDICSVNTSRLIQAGGSAFGEIVIWTSQQNDNTSTWSALPMHLFEAHNGSIFGVRISGLFTVSGKSIRLVASCSDDRQIRVHNISDSQEQIATQALTRTQETGFVNQMQADYRLIATTWGHQSRIWGAEFATALEHPDRTSVRILSRGEDATCQSWWLTLRSGRDNLSINGVLRLEDIDRHHTGKHVWSSAHLTIDGRAMIVSGGADGRLMRRLLPSIDDRSQERMTVLFKDVSSTTTSHVLKEYAIVDSSHTLALSNSGQLLLFTRRDQQPATWQVIVSPSGSKVTKLCSNCSSGFAIAMIKGGLAFWCPSLDNQLVEASYPFAQPINNLQMAGMSPGQLGAEDAVYIVLTSAGYKSIFLIELRITRSTLAIFKQWNIGLAHGFAVTAAYFHVPKHVLMLGSRSGSLTVFDVHKSSTAEVSAISSLHVVHNMDAVTSIQSVSEDSYGEKEDQIHILTTGRDGTYAIHAVRFTDHTKLSFGTVHRSRLSFGPNVEGATLDRSTKELRLFGFKSTKFVVWNERKQKTVVSVDCGGPHRSWAYQKHPAGPGTFVWTKASAVHLLQTAGDQAGVVQSGGHGREIKALAVSPISLLSARLGSCHLVATGAEDTEIRLFAVSKAVECPASRITCLGVLRDHTTGPQHLCFTSSGSHLVSSGGCEQLYIWRLTYDVPFVEVGVVLQDQMPRAEEDADVRVMHFELLKDTVPPGAEGRVEISIAASYSNGKAKIIHYKQGLDPGDGEFQFVLQVRFGIFCLTHVGLHGIEDNGSSVMLTAGTNGFLNFSRLTSSETALTDPEELQIHKVHQNSVQALETLELLPDLWLIVTGGDDNALGFTLRKSQLASGAEPCTLLIPKAHAAALTALRILDFRVRADSFYAIVVTAGNDQKLKLWSVNIPRPWPGEAGLPVDQLINAVQVSKMQEAWTCVADVSNIEHLRSEGLDDEHGRVEVIVVGVGMELMRIVFESQPA